MSESSGIYINVEDIAQKVKGILVSDKIISKYAKIYKK
jgi:hypothetical protein